MTLEQRVQWLEDRAALEDLAALYCRGADSRDAALFSSVWHEDAVWDVGTYAFCGRPEIMSAVAHQWETFQNMQHWTSNSRYDINGDHATGEHDIAALTTLADGSTVLSGGRYRDEFERRDGIWGFTKRTASILTAVALSAPDQASPPA